MNLPTISFPLNVLVVEDSADDAELMTLRLKKEGFVIHWRQVQTEIDYRAALTQPYDLILSDWSLPQFSGLRALLLMRDQGLDLPFIIVSGNIGEESAVNALRQGAYDYVLKDRPERLGQAVRNALEKKRLREEEKHAALALRESEEYYRALFKNNHTVMLLVDAKTGAIVDANLQAAQFYGWSVEEITHKKISDINVLSAEAVYQNMQLALNDGDGHQSFEFRHRKKDGEIRDVEVFSRTIEIKGQSLLYSIIHDITERKQAEEALKTAYDATLRGWSKTLELREHETANHSQRVADLTTRLAKALQLDSRAVVHIERGALLHDIGKIAVPDEILLKKGPLTPEEWVVMRQHPEHARTLLAGIPYLAPALDIPYGHHERWDGTGYPLGLKGEAIPLAARIFAVVDVWDALLSDRPYRLAWPEPTVIQYLKDQSGIQFDPRVVEIFLNLHANSAQTAR